MKSLRIRRFWSLFVIVAILFTGLMPAPEVNASGTNYISFYYTQFQNDGRLKMNGSASITGNKLQLTPAAATQGGSAFNNKEVSLKNNSSFSTYFTFSMPNKGGYQGSGGNDRGADGFVFVVQTQSSSAGSSGSGMGFSGITPSVGIEFDTWKNSPPEDSQTSKNDPNNNHIALVTNGDNYHSNASYVKSVDPMVIDFNPDAGTPVHAWVDYNGSTGTIQVRLSTTNVRPAAAELEVTGLNLRNILGKDEVFVGFTAATGGAYQTHNIESWYFNNEYGPIDVVNNNYGQAPTNYLISSELQPDGTVKVKLTAVAGAVQSGIPITVTATNGAIVQPGTVITDANGEAFVTVINPTENPLTTVVRAIGPGGIYADLTINIPKPPAKSAAPANVVANATTDVVNVPNVPAGATVKVYDDLGNVIGTATNNGASAATVPVTIASGLAHNQAIDVTITEVSKLESDKVEFIAQANQSAAPVVVTANSTTDTVVVNNVPAGATVNIYNNVGGVIGTATNSGGSTANVTVNIGGAGLSVGQVIDATITELNKLESTKTPATAAADQSAAPVDVVANSTTDTVVVGDVPAGATVNIYNGSGTVIGTATNNGGSTADVTVNIGGAGLTVGQVIDATITEPNK
ncbi:lectin-like domain-containing protein, partial [Paenibacillus plantiphilus]|uniref:lectin-like domain-containing protein n=1 Tax=Paenibacillus plantiphilus TaxID=2905650 RepID=UPI001F323D06